MSEDNYLLLHEQFGKSYIIISFIRHLNSFYFQPLNLSTSVGNEASMYRWVADSPNGRILVLYNKYLKLMLTYKLIITQKSLSFHILLTMLIINNVKSITEQKCQ